jgi:MAF protein
LGVLIEKTMHSPKIILASSSPYRKELLNRLHIPFDCISPDIDETPHENETPNALSARLANEKAAKIAPDYPDAIVIGSDQVAMCHGEPLGKPYTRDNAIKQLCDFSKQTVTFHTALCVMRGSTVHTHVSEYGVQFRDLSLEEIERYVDIEQPLNCAGSFKTEGLGISLFEKQFGDDPTSLIGLPLIKTSEYLRAFNLQVP